MSGVDRTPRARAVTVAIDGPAGSGKTTVAREVARRLCLPHVDTGSMYRAATLKAFAAGVSPADGDGLRRLLGATDIVVGDGKVVMDGVDVSGPVRSAAVTAAVSQVAAQPAVREWMVARQRQLLGERGGVMEGRDIGTAVLPGADFKFFLTATPEERARRRAAELRAEGVGTSEAAVLEEIKVRDALDSSRAVAPLRVAPGAVVIDSTAKSIDEVVDEIVRAVEGGSGG
ncbi:MAG TPA: (d)CMP kinase [Actinomycetota bacterium]|nr:(d)CMP kinase [Actinomycetota bacterium]